MQVTALDLARRYEGLKEIPGPGTNPIISGMLGLVLAEMTAGGIGALPLVPPDDETAWCATLPAQIAFLLNLPRPAKHADAEIRRLALRARSWLTIGTVIDLANAAPGWDLVVLNRAGGITDPTIINAPGHVGFYLEHDPERVRLFGGNQGNHASASWYPWPGQLLGVRRWWTGP
jgi:hypothetical protein